MSEDDMTNVAAFPTQSLDPPNRRVMLAKLKSREIDELLAESARRIQHVQKTDPRIDQCQSIVIFKQQAMTDDRRIARHKQRAAVEMMNLDHWVMFR